MDPAVRRLHGLFDARWYRPLVKDEKLVQAGQLFFARRSLVPVSSFSTTCMLIKLREVPVAYATAAM